MECVLNVTIALFIVLKTQSLGLKKIKAQQEDMLIRTIKNVLDATYVLMFALQAI